MNDVKLLGPFGTKTDEVNEKKGGVRESKPAEELPQHLYLSGASGALNRRGFLISNTQMHILMDTCMHTVNLSETEEARHCHI